MAKKVIKVTTKQLQTIIAEEASRYKKVLELKRRKDEITSQLNEMYEESEIDEIFGLGKDPAKEKAAADAMNANYDAAAQAWINGLHAKNPNLNLAVYQQEVAKSKPAAVAGAIGRSKEWGAKGGKFVFLTKGGKLIVQYEQGNVVPSTGMGMQPGATGTNE